jgi:uncharacterized protein
MSLPDSDTILGLHKRYAPHENAFAIVYGHCQIVAVIASELITSRKLSVDPQLVRAATLLHDVGYYPLFDASGYVPKTYLITHVVVGAELLRKEGMPEAVCRIAERHTGVGLTRENIIEQKLPLPARDLGPETDEEWLITYADKLHSKYIKPDELHDATGCFNSPESYLEHARKFGSANAERFARLVDTYGVPDLPAVARKYRQELV